MDFTSFMAGFALLAFWLNTLLIAGAGVNECVALRRRYADRLAPGRLRRGTVAGAAGGVARWSVVQVGRSNGRGPILFHDRARVSTVLGGALQLDDGARIELPAGAAGEVWLAQGSKRRAAACAGAEAFAAALPGASRAAGWERRVELELGGGQPIWLGGQVDGAPIVLADADPRAWRTRITGLTVLLVVGLVAVAGGCTLLCLWPPVFGTLSKVGAFAAVVAFNLFQLFGKLHHDAIQPPSERALEGGWTRPRG
jgi:hypothetical protein